jgi:hypothetical protein
MDDDFGSPSIPDPPPAVAPPPSIEPSLNDLAKRRVAASTRRVRRDSLVVDPGLSQQQPTGTGLRIQS